MCEGDWHLLTIDKDCNIILGGSQEYRAPTSPKHDRVDPLKGRKDDKVASRYVGLIVLPGEHIHKIELEEFDPTAIV